MESSVLGEFGMERCPNDPSLARRHDFSIVFGEAGHSFAKAYDFGGTDEHSERRINPTFHFD